MNLVFIKLVEQIQFDSETAQLAAIAKQYGAAVEVVTTDYGSDEKALLGRIIASAPDWIALRLTRQTFEAQAHVLQTLRKQGVTAAVAIYGPLVLDDPELARQLGGEEEAARLLVLSGISEFTFVRALGAAAAPSEAPDSAASEIDAAMSADDFPNPDFGVFGGSELFRRGIGCSLFAETQVAPIEISVGERSEPPVNAALESFVRRLPRALPFKLRSEAQLADRLRHLKSDFPLLRGIEIRDLSLPVTFAPVLGRLIDEVRPLTFSMRADDYLTQADDIAAFAAVGVKRFVFEWDAVDSAFAAKYKGLRDPQKTVQLIAAAKKSGCEVGVLVTAGLPGESGADIDAKIATLRALEVDRVRILPFEARFGGPLWSVVEAGGMQSKAHDAWNREVYRPLVQDSLPATLWHEKWQRCLDYQAELSQSWSEPVGA
ncbi:MAG: hypothetical protein V3W41_16135 [Planctomycetota bacterium]